MGVGVKVTKVPGQMLVALALMLIAGTNVELTVIVMAFEVAVVGEAQLAVEVIMQVTMSLFAKEEVVNVLPEPAPTPLMRQL